MPTATDLPRFRLPANLGLTAASPLAADLMARRGEALAIDASRVERLGGLCLQVLLSARLTWKAEGQPLVFVDPSSAFSESWALFGCPPLDA